MPDQEIPLQPSAERDLTAAQHLHRLLLPLILILLSGDLLAQPSAQRSQQSSSAYIREIESWHRSRINNLKADNGWLNLAGLFWLNEGKNSFGSDSGNAMVFPQGTIAASAGYFECNGNTVKMVVQNNLDVRVNGAAVKEAVIYAGDSTRPPVVSSGSLR
ncbi:MAG TPA: hypothetical protein VL727_20570 [Puia sp.]|nr:hypothetical protein [Puia sp.]